MAGLFDRATCWLAFNFVPREERVPMVEDIWRPLKTIAPLVVAHLSVADAGAGCQGGIGARDLWLSRYSAFHVASGMSPEMAHRGRAKVASELAVLTPQQDKEIPWELVQ